MLVMIETKNDFTMSDFNNKQDAFKYACSILHHSLPYDIIKKYNLVDRLLYDNKIRIGYFAITLKE